MDNPVWQGEYNDIPIQVNAAHPLAKGLVASWSVDSQGYLVKVYPSEICNSDWCSKWGTTDEPDQPIIVEEKK